VKVAKKIPTWFCKPDVIDSECARDSDVENAHARYFVDNGIVIKVFPVEVEAETGRAGMEGDEEDKWFTNINGYISLSYRKLLQKMKKD